MLKRTQENSHGQADEEPSGKYDKQMDV